MQLTIEKFPKRRPNITLEQVFSRMKEIEYEEPSTKEIRLAIELAKQKAPMNLDFYDAVRSILKCNVSDERIYTVKPFKKIIYKRVIEFKDGKHKTVKRIRRRRK